MGKHTENRHDNYYATCLLNSCRVKCHTTLISGFHSAVYHYARLLSGLIFRLLLAILQEERQFLLGLLYFIGKIRLFAKRGSEKF